QFMKRTSLIALCAVLVSIGALVRVAGGAADERMQQSPPRRASRAGKPRTLPSALGPSLVSVSGRQLLVRRRNPDGTLAAPAVYVLRGVAWSPASPNTGNTIASRRPEFGIWKNTDIPLLKTMNVNTVYTFFDPGLDANGTAVLDKLY